MSQKQQKEQRRRNEDEKVVEFEGKDTESGTEEEGTNFEVAEARLIQQDADDADDVDDDFAVHNLKGNLPAAGARRGYYYYYYCYYTERY